MASEVFEVKYSPRPPLESASIETNENYPYTLVGQGTPRWKWNDDKKESEVLCGTYKSIYSCEHRKEDEEKKHDLHIIYNSCFNPICPVCYELWANRQTLRSVSRIYTLAWSLYNHGIHQTKLRHFTFNPPEAETIEYLKTNDIVKLRRKLIYRLKKYSKFYPGGIIVFHSHRADRELIDGELKVVNWRISPHFHIIGFGHYDTKELQTKKNPWVYKHHGYLNSPLDFYNCLSYELKHAGIRKDRVRVGANGQGRGKHVVVPYGAFTNYSFRVMEHIKKKVPVTCKKCEGKLYEVDPEAYNNWDPEKILGCLTFIDYYSPLNKRFSNLPLHKWKYLIKLSWWIDYHLQKDIYKKLVADSGNIALNTRDSYDLLNSKLSYSSEKEERLIELIIEQMRKKYNG